MSRPRVIDTFMINDELDMLECRLTELGEAVDHFVAVEADVDHQDHAKSFVLSENIDRFAPWADKLTVVRAKGLPTHEDNPDPWAREHAQRERVTDGLLEVEPALDDIVLHGDIDEIPSVLVARNVRPTGFVVFQQTMCCFAVDWLHPDPWNGTVAARLRSIHSFGAMRDKRNVVRPIRDAGWHFSWLGGTEAALRKLGSFCHPEIEARTRAGIESEAFLNGGFHVDGKKMEPVEVDDRWPRWIREGHAPASWYRPRDVPHSDWTPPTGLE